MRHNRTSKALKPNAGLVSRRDTLFREIIDQRGGEAVLSHTEIAVAKSLARLLTPDSGIDPRDAATATALFAQLPPKREDAPWNLTLLSDAQLHQLETLAAICTGQAPPAKQPRKRQTSREYYAAKLANLFDAIEARGGNVTNDECLQARNYFVAIVGRHVTMARIFQDEIAPAPSVMPASAPPPAPAPAAAPAILPDNVTQLHPIATARDIHSHPAAPIKRGDEEWRSDIGRSGFRRFDHPGWS